jgi:hypothetical protein
MWDGFDVFKLNGAEFADADRYAATTLNPQNQPKYDWVWKKQPVLPADRSNLPVLSITPGTVSSGGELKARTVSVSVAPATFMAGDHVDIWMLGTSAPLASTKVDADGGLTTLAIELPADLKPGSYALVARADLSPTVLAWATLSVANPAPTVALIIAIISGVLLLGIGVTLIVRRRIRLVRTSRRRSA